MRVWIVVATAVAIGAIFVSTADWISANPTAENFVPHPASPMLAVNFAHADHTDQNCAFCHHNYLDKTGQGMCFDCHKTDPEVAHLIEEQFHDLCRGCHIDEQVSGGEHGPTRECLACHQKDEQP